MMRTSTPCDRIGTAARSLAPHKRRRTFMRTALILALAALPLAACDSGTEPAPEPAPTEPAAAATEIATPTPTPGETTEVTTIPAPIQGRWGLVAADCEPGRADAKGLLT